MTRAAALLLALAGCGSKDTPPDTALATMTELADQMCACKDTACATEVNAALQRWGADMARTTKPAADKPDPARAKAMITATERMAQCLTKLSIAAMPTPTPEPTPPRPDDTVADLPELPKAPLAVAALVQSARAAATKREAHLVVARLELAYVRADGTLDPKYGELVIEFRAGSDSDDSRRPIGAPVPEPVALPDDCPTWTVHEVGGWIVEHHGCTPEVELPPARCSVQQIFARAIKDGAPAAALAGMKLVLDGTSPAVWKFSVVDAPRRIDFQRVYRDDCTPIIERPK
ncbi:MAG: hypothetical protein ABI867_25145 [Kofleriaceae bacterium]